MRYTELKVLIDNFIEKNYFEEKAANTIKTYKRILDSFYLFLREKNITLEIESLKPSLIHSYLHFKEEKMKKGGKLRPKTKILYISTLKTFFNYIAEEIQGENGEIYDFDKLFKKIKIKNKKSQPKGLSSEEQNKLFEYLSQLIKQEKNVMINARNSLMIKTMLLGGLRVSEMRNMKFTNYLLEEEQDTIFTVYLTGKGDKDRITYIPKEAIEKELFILGGNKQNKYVCLSKNGTILDRKNIDTMIKNICIKAGIVPISAHKLRHSFAKNFLSNGGNVVYLKELLGHSDIKTTMIYTNPYQKDIKENFIKGLQNAK